MRATRAFGKVTRKSSLCVVFILSFILRPSAFPQGSLTPPGTPAPTMKTLDQVEARVIVNAANCPGDGSNSFLISQPGSYYLTGNITGESGKNGIRIAGVDDVTLDLNGFELVGVSGSQNGISASGANVIVRNGSARNWGGAGISIISSGGLVEAFRASANGIGLNITFASAVRCSALSNTGDGFQAADSIVDRCTAILNNVGVRIGVGNVVDCVLIENTATGVVATKANVSKCTVNENGTGIETSDSYVFQNNCTFNTTAVMAAGNDRIESNHLADNTVGLKAISIRDVIRNNTVLSNTTNYSLVVGNEVELLLSQVPETINVPAKVILAGTLTGVSGSNGITITSDNVTVDLAGHALVGVSGSLAGILVSGARTNISVKNGVVRTWGGDGIDGSTAGNGAVYADLEVTNNGAAGLHAASRALINRITSLSNGGAGITSGSSGAVKISDCMACLNTGFGIVTGGNDATVQNCLVNQNTGGGIQVTGRSLVQGNTVDNHGGVDGILATGTNDRIQDNHLTNNGVGLHVTGTANFIVRNSAVGNTTAYTIAGGNDTGPIGSAATSTSPWANLQ